MQDDPVLDDLRRIREKLLEEAGGDPRRLFERNRGLVKEFPGNSIDLGAWLDTVLPAAHPPDDQAGEPLLHGKERRS